MSYRKPSRSDADAPPPFVLRRMPPGTRFLGSDPFYWYFSHPTTSPQLGGFFDDVGKMFTRMVKITPKSFTPGNIYEGVINTALTGATFGAYQILPKNVKKTVYEVGKVAVPAVAGAVLAYNFGPAVWNTLAPKISAAASFIGKHADTIGKTFFSVIGKLSPSQQAQMAQEVTPEQIAYMEQSGALPANLQQQYDQWMQASAPLPVPSTGAASLYDPSMMAAVELERQKQNAPPFDPTWLLLLGVPVVALVALKK